MLVISMLCSWLYCEEKLERSSQSVWRGTRGRAVSRSSGLPATGPLHGNLPQKVCAKEICMFYLEGKCQRPLVAKLLLCEFRRHMCYL